MLRLVNFSIGQNELTDLPSDLTDIDATLVKLDISSNAMRVLPPVILRLTRLKKLHAQHLLLTRLPENIGDLQCLEMLYLGGNCLSTLPASFRRLKRLTTLNLNGVAWMKSRQDAIVSRENFDEFLKAHNLSGWLESNRKVVFCPVFIDVKCYCDICLALCLSFCVFCLPVRPSLLSLSPAPSPSLSLSLSLSHSLLYLSLSRSISRAFALYRSLTCLYAC